MESEAVLTVLFSFVGRGHFLYVAGVSCSWRTHYTAKTKAEAGTLMTRCRDAVATITCLEYAFADDQDFLSIFRPSKDDFGPGVYKWARQHGLPLFVWVAFQSITRYDRAYAGAVLGAFSSANKAKNGVRPRCQFLSRTSEWEAISPPGFRWDDGFGSSYVCVMAFAVNGVAHADETDPLHLFVTSRTSFFSFQAEGVFPTRELANKSIVEIAHNHMGSFRKGSGVMYRVGDAEYALAWEGCLDGIPEDESYS